MFNVIPEILYKLLSLIFPIILLFGGSSTAALDYSAKVAEVQAGADYTGLGKVYEDYFPIGAAVYSWELDDPRLVDFILKNFNTIVPEWELKQHYLCDNQGDPSRWGQINEDHLATMDRLADFVRAHDGLRMRGHTLIWPVSDTWMLWTDATETTLVSKEVLFERMEEYIKFIMLRYRDVIDVWDVVNEPFHYNWFQQLKEETKIFQIAGEEFVTKAFEIAAKYAKPGDMLMVNETFVEGNAAKTANMFNCVERWLKQGVRIDGIGTQGHMGTVSTLPFDPNFKTIDDLAKRCRQLGIKLEYTEIDIKVFEIDRQRTAETPPDWLATWQIFKYQKFFEAMRRNKDVVIGATFWGLDDAHSAVVYGENGLKDDWPMLFDRSSMPKQNFFAVCDF